MRSGGSVANIPGCTTCNAFIRNNQLTDFHEYTGAGSKFGTRAMKEVSAKSTSRTKIRNGKIEKIVVVESGVGTSIRWQKSAALHRDTVTTMME